MGDVFLRALGADLQQTQRALPPLCLFCVPQPRSLLADEALTQDVLYTHFLTPADDEDARLGQYNTLNGKQVAVVGSHIHTGKGFKDRRQVRILLSEKREIQLQELTVLHISRPLEGGIEIPEDPSEIDVATFRKYTAILRSFPENELVFYQLDETVSQVHKICMQEQVYERYKQTLPANLKEEWEAAVEELIHAGSFDDVEEDYRLQRRHGGGVSHLLQIQQVVECYLMESLHDLIFPRVVASCQEQDRKLQQVLYRMRHYTPEDFGLQKEFQCFASEARDTLLTVVEKKTPLDMLLVFKACIDRVSDAITRNIKLRRLDFEAYQLTTDDILDQLLFVLYGKLGRRTEGMLDMAQPRQLGGDWTGWSMDMKSRIGSGDRSVVRRIAAGKDHSLAINSDGAGFTWGRGDSGQLGHGCYMDVSEPKQNGTVYICGHDPSLDVDNIHLSPALLTLPSSLEREFFGQIASVSCGEAHFGLLAKSGVLLLSYPSFSQPSADAGSTTTEVQERRVAWVKEVSTVRRMICGASHTLAVS
ncbi:hypothetical protein PF008_g11453 [Phytophthora fragariae]|uniref:VPS9 domain-containing protein n=1 Tax=Phytophthora fragariae TaxID=53985 RepID=A0A6G0RQQ7_9STRA|nr:hypothetical protein PF008_g11453 [Phytophthora fragariae]